MDKKELDELFVISDMFETIFYALRWFDIENNTETDCNSIITDFEYTLNKLKNFCHNQTLFSD